MVQFSQQLDSGFAAIADSTRRGIVDVLASGERSITELAEQFDMTLTGMKKHVRILEDAGMVESAKIGRTRVCRLGRRRPDQEIAWLENYRQMIEQRYDRLEAFLEQQKGKA